MRQSLMAAVIELNEEIDNVHAPICEQAQVFFLILILILFLFFVLFWFDMSTYFATLFYFFEVLFTYLIFLSLNFTVVLFVCSYYIT